ncbi:MAG: hypothetical protein PHE79_03320 [Eubacteriales bacterium]|nr:hypothetical protein [Eubacteriales bacterium]
MFEYLTLDNITLALAVFGSVGTILTWVISAFRNHKNLSIKPIPDDRHAITFSTQQHLYATMAVIIENKSRLPIAITQFQVINADGKPLTADLIPAFIYHQSNNIVPMEFGGYSRIIESAEFPINICALGAAQAYMHFTLPLGTNLQIRTILLHTNRGIMKFHWPGFSFPMPSGG